MLENVTFTLYHMRFNIKWQDKLVNSKSTGLNPILATAHAFVEFFNSAIVVNASTTIIQLMTHRIDSDGSFFVDDILFEGVLGSTRVRQLPCYLMNYFTTFISKQKGNNPELTYILIQRAEFLLGISQIVHLDEQCLFNRIVRFLETFSTLSMV